MGGSNPNAPSTFGQPGNQPPSRPANGVPTSRPTATTPDNSRNPNLRNPNAANAPGNRQNTRPGAQQRTTGGDPTGNGNTVNNPNGTDIQTDAQGNPVLDNTEQTDEQRVREQSPEEMERQRIRERVFGYSIFNGSGPISFEPNPRLSAPPSYVIGAEDVLNVLVYGFTDFNAQLPVNRQGNIIFPRVGPIAVSGLTLAQAEEKIRNRASQIIGGLKGSAYGPQNTFLRVTIEQVRTIRISLIGEVARPAEYNVSSLTTAYNALYLSGGPTEIGSFRNIQVKRKDKLIRTIDLYNYLLNADKKDDINLQDDDVLFVPAYKTRVDLNGEVKKPGLYEVQPGETLGKVLEFAGGFTEVAYRSTLKLIRLTDRDRRLVDIKGEDVNNYVLQNADIIAVERILDRYNNVVNILGSVFRPGQYSLDENPTLKKLLDRAEGITPDAFTGRVVLLRRKPDLTIEQLTFDLAKVLRGEAADIPLQKEDEVRILSVAQLREGNFVRIQGQVLNPYFDENTGHFPWYEGMTIEDLLISAGGLRQGASAFNIEVVRPTRNNNSKTVDSTVAYTYTVSVSRDLSKTDSSSRFVLQPFDEVFVRAAPNYQAPQFVTIEGQVITPGPYGIKNRDERISDIISRAGGLNQFAYVPGATLLRVVPLSQAELAQRQRSLDEISDDSQRAAVVADPIPGQEQVGIDLKRILDNPHSAEDLILQEGDVIRIPKEQQTVRVGGEVFYPTTTRYSPGAGFLEYVSRSGGFTSRSIKRRSYVLYANGNVQRTKRFLFFNTYPRVEPGAEVIVPLKTRADITTAQIVGTLGQTLGALTSAVSIFFIIKSLSK